MTADRASGARPRATVMFADLTGFTAMSERMDPEAATDLVNQCFAVLESVVVACGGVIDKYIGDCIVAVWDLPDAARGAEQAGRAAWAIHGAVRAFNEAVAPPAPLDVHIGLGTGPLIAGHVGGERTGAFSVIGEPVVLAERLGEASPRGQIYVDAETHDLSADAFAYRSLDALILPPRPEPVVAFELRDLAARTPDTAGIVADAVTRGTAPPGRDQLTERHQKRGSERRQATVVFAEVVGFDSLARAMAPERFIQLLNRCFAALEPAVHTYGGVVDKYVGETVMALFGVPNAIEHAPRQALNAAIEMRHALQRFVEEQGLVGQLQLHVGVNSGLVIAGELGGPTTRTFTVIGDAVNVAARLKAAAGDDTTYVGRETHRYTHGDFDFVDMPPLALKGKGQPVPVWKLASDQHRRTPAAPSGRQIHSQLVGRERELADIEQAVHQVARGRGGIATVIGEAGIGKSRLMAELFNLSALKPLQVLEGRSLSIGQGLSFHPFVDLLRRWAGIGEDDGPREASAKLARAVRELMPDDFDDVLPFIARLMGLRVAGELAERVQGLEGEAMEELIFKSVRELLEHLARRRPLVLLFEDLHWADQSSIKLLESLLRLVVSEPVLIIGVGRPEFPDTIGRIVDAARDAHASQLVELHLRELTDQQCDALIQNLLKTDALPYATRALIIRKAEGNPFYIEEVIRSFIDAGVVVYQHGRFRLTEKIQNVEVPGTIQEVIMARVDRLDEPTRHVLQIASVIGRNFYHRILAEVIGPSAELELELDQLKTKQLVIERRSRDTSAVRRRSLTAELEYVFTHALAQEAIYESLLQRTRKELHRRVAASIETLFADRLVDFYGMLAYHYSRAEDLEKAEEFLFKAGEEAARSAASTEALTFFREASQLYFRIHGDGGDPRKKALLEKNIALALLNTGGLTESIDHFDAGLAHLGIWVPQSKLTAGAYFAFNLLALLGQLYLRIGRHRRVRDWDAEREFCEICFNRGRAEITSDPTRLFFDTVAAFRHFNEIDATKIDQASAMYVSAAAVFCYSGVSFAVSRRAIEYAKRLIRPGNVRDEFTVRSMEFIYHYLAGDWRTAPVIDPDFVDEALRYGQLWDVNTYLGLYSDLLLRRGEFRAAHSIVDQLGELNDSYGFDFAGTNHDAMITLLLLEERKLPEALQAAEHYQSARHEETLKVLGLGSKAKAQVLLGDLEGADVSLAAAQRIASRARLPPWHLSAYAAARLRYDAALLAADGATAPAIVRMRARRSLRFAVGVAGKAALQRVEIFQLAGRVCWLLGQTRRALRWWERGLAVAVQMEARPELARTYALAAQCLAERGGAPRLDGLDAAACAARARETFGTLGLTWDLAQLEEMRRVRAA